MKNNYIDKLRSKDLKLTPKRGAILDYFIKEGRCMTPEHVWKMLKVRFKQLGLPSIYRNLEQFESCGILTKIQKEDRKLYYALCPSADESLSNHEHYHILCIECGKVDDVDHCSLPEIKTDGFKVLSHFLQFEGLCAQCS